MNLSINHLTKIIHEEVNKYLTAYHGSNADFNNFDLAYVNTGNKEQAYGYGIYLSLSPEGATHYGNKLYTVKIPKNNNLYLNSDENLSPVFLKKTIRLIYNYIIKHDEDELYLDPYSRHALIEEINASFNDCDGLSFYGGVSYYLGSDKLASEFIYTNLKKIGIKYKVGEIENVVMFNPNDIQIIDKKN